MTHVSAGLLVIVSGLLGVSMSPRPPYIDCQTSAECGKDSCCVIGMGRYSIPTCRPRREVGESCRISGDTVNTTLHYPDGVSVDLTDVFYILCPCQGGLVCSDSSSSQLAQCEEPFLHNHLDDYNSAEDSAQVPRT